MSFTSVINSELGDVETTQSTEFIACTDCNGDFGGGALLIVVEIVSEVIPKFSMYSFSPAVTVSLSNTNCDSLTDLTIC